MLMSVYGLTVEQYEEMFSKQDGVCAICKQPWKTRRLAVDHCHKTGKIRGLLCGRCNGQLGWLENEQWVTAAKEYLAGTYIGRPVNQTDAS